MIKRYAIEPRAVADPWKLRYVLEKMGLDEGRAVLEYPRKNNWIKQVHDNVGQSDEMRKKLTEVWKKHKDIAFVGTNGALIKYEGRDDWAENAKKNLNYKYADGVVFYSCPIENIADLRIVDIDDADDSFFLKCREVSIECSAKALADVARTIIFKSKHLILIDPYFDIGKKFTRLVVLEALIDIIKQAESVVSLTIVCEQRHVERDLRFEKDLKETVESCLFAGLKREFHFEYRMVDSEASVNKLHKRFLLSDVAGLVYDRGFEVREARDQKDKFVMQDVSMVPEEVRAERIDLYVNGNDPDVEVKTREKFRWEQGVDGNFRLGSSIRPPSVRIVAGAP